MSYNWDGLMELLSGKYRPTWSSLCGGSDVKGVMELESGKYKPVADAHGMCEELDGVMVNDGEGKYFPRIVLAYEDMCCAGEDCSVCDDELWNSGETPKRVQVVFTGITEEACSEGNDPNGTYILNQMELWPCWWYSEPDANGFFCYYTCSGGYPATSGVVLGTVNKWYFGSKPRPACKTGTFEGGYTSENCCAGTYDLYNLGPKQLAAYGGEAIVSWPIE